MAKEDKTEDLGIKMTSKEGAIWETTVTNIEKEMLQMKVENELNEYILEFVKKKAKECAIDLGAE